MRDYSRFNGNFWIGRTGRSLRGHPEAQLVAVYLITSPNSDMTGVYHCPVAYIANETGLSAQGATKGLARLIEAGFCTFDAESDFVFVHEMAKHQIGETLKEADKRWAGVHNRLRLIPDGPCKRAFIARYAEPFKLDFEVPPPSPSEAPSKGLASSMVAPSKPRARAGARAGASDQSPKFEEFWRQYPKKVDKQEAIKAFKEIDPDDGLFSRLLSALELQKASRQWTDDEGKFIPYPATWLNRRRWEAEKTQLEKPNTFAGMI